MRKLRDNGLLILILAVGLVLRILAIIVDPFLHPWDERFHALVARNMMDNPLVPILRVNPITENYDKFIWCCNHIWVHKQPLFMWQMNLSMKLFGVSEWSMRLPSAIMGTVLILLIYRIVIILTSQKRIALLTALMLALSNFHLQMISGIHGMDHNDVAHGFYVLASIWAFCEYQKSGKWYWILFVGLFSGAAVLNKWLTGLLVYLIWGVSILFSICKREKFTKSILFAFVSLITCLAVFIPWQIYILSEFTELAKYEFEYNQRHLSEAIEGHEGSNLYYFDYLKGLFGAYLYYLIPIGIFLSVKARNINKTLNLSFISALVFVFLFFSLVAKTKVDTYLFFIVPLALIYVAMVLDYVIKVCNKYIKNVIQYPIVIMSIAYLSLNPLWIVEYISPENSERNNRIYNANIYRNLKESLPENVKVVMNTNSFEDIDVMFYNKGITAYHWTLSEADFEDFERRKIPIAVFESHGAYTLPEYVSNYPYIFVICQNLKDF